MVGDAPMGSLHHPWKTKALLCKAGGFNMNMNNAPAQDQLRELLYACDDTAGDHILWADGLGEVHITLLMTETLAAWIQRMNGRVQFQYKTYIKDQGEVGQAAANDSMYVGVLFKKLLKDWHDRKDGPNYL
jgi:hypothetical protein